MEKSGSIMASMANASGLSVWPVYRYDGTIGVASGSMSKGDFVRFNEKLMMR
jgi:hypothetical protein